MNEQQPKRFNFWWVVIPIALLGLFVMLQMNQGSKPEIDKSEFVSKIGVTVTAEGDFVFAGGTHDVFGVYNEGYNYYVLYKADYDKMTETKKKEIRDNYALIKSNCSATVYDNTNYLSQVIAEYDLYVQTVNTDADQTNNLEFHWGSAPTPGNWFNDLMSWIWIPLLGVLIYMMWRATSGRSGIGELAQDRATVVFNSPIRFNDVAGIEEEKEQVAEIVDFLRNPKKYIDIGARIPKGVLLVGAPGTGKTLLAKAIAGEAGVPFFSLSGSDFSEMLVGVGPSRMRNLFERAKAAAAHPETGGAIIFLDEIDSVARMRGVGASGVAEENEQTLNQLLVQMDGFSKSEGVIVLAATNRPDVLDPALLRPGRFDRQIIVQMPDVRGREQILKVHSKNKPFGDVNLNKVAKITSGFSGADLENLLNESAIIAAKDGRAKISMTDIMEGINKVLMGPQKKSRIITEEDKKITAFHEAGHAVISRVLMPKQTVQEVSIIPRGMAAGYTLTNDQDDEHNHQSRSMLINRITMLLGGRSAEQLFIGDICTGASNDIKVATNIAENMVTKWGMSEKLGPLYYGKEDEVALRVYNEKHTSESLQSVIDAEVKSLIANAVAECRKILSENAGKAKVMANVLLAHETIYADDIAMIMGGASEKEITKKIEEREKAEADSASKSKADGVLATLEPLLERSKKTAASFKESGLKTKEQIEQLERNFELARKYASEKLALPPIPTVDNIEKYAELIAEKKEPAPAKESPKEKKKPHGDADK